MPLFCVYCPEKTPEMSQPPCTIICNNTCANADIYTKNGIPYDAKLICGSSGSNCDDAVLFCGNNYAVTDSISNGLPQGNCLNT